MKDPIGMEPYLGDTVANRVASASFPSIDSSYPFHPICVKFTADSMLVICDHRKTPSAFLSILGTLVSYFTFGNLFLLRSLDSWVK